VLELLSESNRFIGGATERSKQLRFSTVRYRVPLKSGDFLAVFINNRLVCEIQQPLLKDATQEQTKVLPLRARL